MGVVVDVTVTANSASAMALIDFPSDLGIKIPRFSPIDSSQVFMLVYPFF